MGVYYGSFGYHVTNFFCGTLVRLMGRWGCTKDPLATTSPTSLRYACTADGEVGVYYGSFGCHVTNFFAVRLYGWCVCGGGVILVQIVASREHATL